MYLLILLLPLFGSLVVGLGGRWLGYYGASFFSTICVVLSLIFSLMAFYEVAFLKSNCYLVLGM